MAKSKDTTAALTALQKSISQNNSGLTLSFTLSGTRVSTQQAPICNLADLVSKARAQAQDIAGAAGFKAGAIVGLTSATSNAAPLCSFTARFALGAMFDQPGPNSITITATRTNNIQPDQVVISLGVTSGPTAGLDVVPLAKLSATVMEILSAQQAISGNNSGLTLTFFVGASQVSQQSQQSQPCSQAALLADAQAQAKQVAAAAGVSAGPVLSMDSVGSAALQLSLAAVTILQTTCSLAVQFQLM